jgi:putative sigma-54 modulation protein
MNIEYTSRHLELHPALRAYADKKLRRLAKFLEEEVTVHLVLEADGHRQRAELKVSHRHGQLHAQEEAADLRDAVRTVVEKVEKQARRDRKRFQQNRRRAQRGGAGNPDVDEAVEG